MSEQASNIAREAKGLQQGLKEILKARDPWDREVDFQRKNLRRQYLRLLLVHPYTKESKDAETYLWMQTSYAFIAIYKQRIAVLDQTLRSAPRLQQQQSRQEGHGPVEYRKLMQRFRQFLAEEEKFWTQLVVRFRRSFLLNEVQQALVALGILPTTDSTTGNVTSEAQEGVQHPRDGGAADGRNHFQFPPEDDTVSVTPGTHAERDGQLTIVSKALVCIGDIARYRELYNESGGRPRAGQEDNVVLRRSGRNRRDAVPRARNYEKAQLCYEQARLLVPHEGNPWHQLAILSTYKKDAFESLVHYYRALCVRQPYDTAGENLGTMLTKALEQWKARIKREKDSGGISAPVAPRLRYEVFKEKVIVLHALWRLGADKMDAISPNHAQAVCNDFTSLISERGLPPDDICRAVVLSQGALWKHRMVRDSASTAHPKQAETLPAVVSATAIESRMFSHLLALHQALLDLSIVELAEPPPTDAATNDLAQRITATFRRTLPALRIASKWLKANFKYVLHESETANGKSSGSHTRKRREHKFNGSTAAVAQFWESYSRFASALLRAFPIGRLPSLAAPLEEDIDMRGFLPLRKMMGDLKAANVHEKVGDTNGFNRTVVPIATQVHPNEEQLMRIADLLDDAQTLAAMENSPIMPHNNQFVLKSSEVALSPDAAEHVPFTPQHDPWLTTREETDPSGIAESEDDAMTDPVRAAFRHLDIPDWDVEDEQENPEDDDEILYPRKSISPVHVLPSPPSRPSPVSPIHSPIGTTPRSLARPSTLVTPTTAQDLLFGMLPVSRPHPSQSSAPQPPLLFGSGPPNRPGHSIWSTTLDDRSPTFPGTSSQPGQLHHAYPQHYPASSQEQPQLIWSPHQHTSPIPPNAPAVGDTSLPLTPQQQHSIISGTHHRTASSPVLVSRPFTNQNQIVHDPFGYSSLVPPHVQRPSQHERYTNAPVASSASQMFYGQEDYLNYHSHHMDQGHGSGVGPFTTQPLSRVWGNPG